MRKIREVLRLRQGKGLSARQVAGAVRVSPATVTDIVRRASLAGVTWPLPEEMDDLKLEELLYPRPAKEPCRPVPPWKDVHLELARKGVTLALLWEEYAAANPDDHYSYQQFARHYRAWKEDVEVTMRQVHRAGEKCFSDFAGQTLPIVDPATGEITQAHLFVACMGFSNYTYAEAFPSEQLPCWIAGHVNALDHFGAAPEIIVCDNPKALVTRADRYEPDLNRTFEDMAEHFGCVLRCLVNAGANSGIVSGVTINDGVNTLPLGTISLLVSNSCIKTQQIPIYIAPRPKQSTFYVGV